MRDRTNNGLERPASGGRRDARLTRLSALYRIADVLTTTRRSDTVLRLILKEAVRATRATSGSLILIDRDAGVLNIKIATNLDPEAAEKMKLRIGEGVTGWVAKTGKPLLAGDVRRSRHYVKIKAEVKSEVAVPLIIGGEVVGVINVDSDRRGAFTEGDKELLAAIAAQSAKVLQAAELNRENRNKAERLSNLFQVAKTVVSEPLLDDVLRRVAEIVRRLMDGRVCSIMLLDEKEENLEIKAVSGQVSPGYLNRKRIAVKGSAIGEAIATARPVYLADVRREKRYRLRRVARESGLCSLLSIPMVFLAKPIGVLNIYSKEPRTFPDEDVALATAFAGHSAVAIINARRYENVLKSEEQLRKSERFQLLGTLSAELAHEIRNPLSVLSMLTHTIQRDPGLGKESRTDLQVIETKLRHMNRIVDQVLNFSRTHQPKPVRVDLNRVLDDVHQLIGYKAAAMGRRVRMRKGRSIVGVTGDPGQIEQAALNLALNGLEAMAERGECLHLSTATARRDGRKWGVLRVRDEGCGLPEERRKEIFTPFFSTRERGTGLGLFITHRIVRQHGGRLKVKSRPGEGSTFEIFLPAVEAGEGEAQSEGPA